MNNLTQQLLQGSSSCCVENGEINAGLTATELSKGVNTRWDFDAENHGKGFSDGLTHDVGHEMDNMLKREERWETMREGEEYRSPQSAAEFQLLNSTVPLRMRVF